MATLIGLVLGNIPAIMFAAAIVMAVLRDDGRALSARLLDWLLLLSVGVMSVWAGLFHVFFPQIAAQSIGWAVSPFQFEIGVADIALGIVAIASFWRSLSFKSAIASFVVLFFIGVAVGHFRQAFGQGDYSPDNFGLLLAVTIALIVMLPVLLWMNWKAVETGRDLRARRLRA